MSVEDSKDLSKVPEAWQITAERIVDAHPGAAMSEQAYVDTYLASVPEGTGNVHQFAHQYGVATVTWADIKSQVPLLEDDEPAPKSAPAPAPAPVAKAAAK